MPQIIAVKSGHINFVPIIAGRKPVSAIRTVPFKLFRIFFIQKFSITVV